MFESEKANEKLEKWEPEPDLDENGITHTKGKLKLWSKLN